jgi:hypothetical protein
MIARDPPGKAPPVSLHRTNVSEVQIDALQLVPLTLILAEYEYTERPFTQTGTMDEPEEGMV